MEKTVVKTISGDVECIEGSDRTTIFLPEGTKIIIENALLSSKAQRNLLSFKYIRKNGYHIKTTNETGNEYLLIIQMINGQKIIFEKLNVFSSGLYYAKIYAAEIHNLVGLKATSEFITWHERLGHPGSIMLRRIIQNSNGHTLINQRILNSNEFTCAACSQGKLITRPSPVKVGVESPTFLERIQGDICGPIDPPCGPFKYFIVLIDASTRWSHVCLLSTRNLAFARLLAQIIKLRAQFPDYPIKKIRLDNAGEYTSNAFDDYCTSIGITVEHPVPHVHTQNGLAESLIKRLQLIARPMLMRTKLPVSAWGHAILHAAALLKIRPTSYHSYSPIQIITGNEPNISHLRIFGCVVYVPITPPHRTKMGPQRRMGIYVGYESPSIIKHLEPSTGNLFTARFADCHFDESNFPTLGGDNAQLKKEISWKIPLDISDPRTKQSELEVQRIVHLQRIANQLPDAFNDAAKVTKSYIAAANAPAKINLPEGKMPSANEPMARQKRGRPLGSKDKNPRKKWIVQTSDQKPKEVIDKDTSPEEDDIPEDSTIIETSFNYITSGKSWNRKEIEIDNIFAYNVAIDVMINDEDPEPKSVDECRKRDDWPKWKEAIQSELNSLNKRNVFGPIVQTPENVKPVGYRWVFVRKTNDNNEIVRYKARLVAQGFSQRPGIDFEETYSPVMDGITFRYLVSLAVRENLEIRLMDVVTAYLYGSLENDIYMKIPEGFKMPDSCKSKPKEAYSIKLQKSLYGLKQSGRMWYNRLSEILVKEGYVNDPICPCVFIKKTGSEFVIIAVYVDDLNLIGTPKELQTAVEYLKKEFEIKDFGKTKSCLGLQIEHLENNIFIHQSAYTQKVLKHFRMDFAHPLSTPMVVRALDPKKDPFKPKEEDEEELGPEVPYLSAIGALMYLANSTRPDIAFAVNLLARFSSCPTRRHWNGIKHIFRYLQGTIDLGLYYSKESRLDLIGYADAGYLSDPHTAKSQTGYVFMCGGTITSWRSMKQTLTATSSNHAEIIAIHEASRECVWLRSIIHHIQKNCDLNLKEKIPPTILFEDNSACIAQLKGGYIKGDRTKHISPKFFFTHDLQKNGEIDVQQIRSNENLADLLTKALPTSTFEKLVQKIGMRRLRDLK